MPETLFLRDRSLIKAPPDLCVVGSSSEPKFPVHRLILMCISPYFEKFFEYHRSLKRVKLRDSRGHQMVLEYIKLDQIEPRILPLIIDYAYSGQVVLEPEAVQQIVIAADMYNIYGLIKEASTFLVSSLHPHNCLGMFLFARAYNCFDLEKTAETFILKHFESIWLDSEEFLTVTTKEIIQHFIGSHHLYVSNELSIWRSLIKWINHDVAQRIVHFEALSDFVRFGLIDELSLLNEVLCHSYVISFPNIFDLIQEVLAARNKLENCERPIDNPVDLSVQVKRHLVPRFPKDMIFVFGGRALDVEFVSPEREVESYDHRAERWRKVSLEDPNGPRDHHQVAVINHFVYVLGGHHGPVNVFNSCRKLNLITKEWIEIAPMREKRAFHASAILDHHIYAIGGYNGSWRVDSVERYDININQWTAMPAMTERRSGAGAAVLDDRIYVVGGFRDLSYLDSAECFNPVTNEWKTITHMLKPRSSPAVVAFKGYLYAIGGLSSSGLLSCGERYDPRTDSWSMMESEMVEKKCSSSAVVLEDKILVIGGWNGVGGLRTVEIWCDQTKRWLLGTKLMKRRTGCAACVVSDLPNIEDYAYLTRESIVQERVMNALGSSHPDYSNNSTNTHSNQEENLRDINRSTNMRPAAPNNIRDLMDIDPR